MIAVLLRELELQAFPFLSCPAQTSLEQKETKATKSETEPEAAVDSTEESDRLDNGQRLSPGSR